jgi:hypothetical protein
MQRGDPLEVWQEIASVTALHNASLGAIAMTLKRTI